MTMRNEYTKEMAVTLEKWSTQLGELQAKAHDAGVEQKAQTETAIAALRGQQEAYREHLKSAREAGDTAFADMRVAAEHIADEFARNYAQAYGRLAS